MKQIIYCKYCNKPINDCLGTINHVCEKSEDKELWKGNIHSGNLMKNSKIQSIVEN